MQGVLLSTAYLPNIEYFSHFVNSDSVFVEKNEHYQKQSYRNRCEILSANGKLELSIPLQKNGDKELISEKRISYAEKWHNRHWRAIESAYRNSPYFDFFEDEFKPFYTEEFDLLFDYNTQLVQTILKILRIKKEIHFTTSFEKETNLLDLRETIHPKHLTQYPSKKYSQVFSDKFGFTPNLSIIDLLFNKGLETTEYLRS